MGHLGRATCTVHSISAQTSQEGIKCTKAKEQLRFYCLIYILCLVGCTVQYGRAGSQSSRGLKSRKHHQYFIFRIEGGQNRKRDPCFYVFLQFLCYQLCRVHTYSKIWWSSQQTHSVPVTFLLFKTHCEIGMDVFLEFQFYFYSLTNNIYIMMMILCSFISAILGIQKYVISKKVQFNLKVKNLTLAHCALCNQKSLWYTGQPMDYFYASMAEQIQTFKKLLDQGTLFRGESLPQNYLFEPPFGQRLCCNF